ncbi:glucosaminidase domain-containing protein [Campylobacter insulaenigrae]|uniref:glucosaminidase domain-containing protein n=1 Tax=Campylobacter insulaenigrae TaxID=260714 RepID=UPI0021533E2C|nr:glucosaminidase domain-containing protein [Campylobacter insulaenigrae]MCR6584682.1 glucosaminidase domain-containing protein [Campylobacter insulaenigrae]
MKLIIIFLVSCILLQAKFIPGFNEDFYTLDINQKREVFIGKISTLLDNSFKDIENEQEFVNNFFHEALRLNFRNLNPIALNRLIELKEKYRIKNLYNIQEYQEKIQKVPKSLAIAQAIIESATGTSRFAKEANNLFGEWTWGDKGLIPKERSVNKTHKIKVFDTLQESVDSYILNLNRHNAYEDFRMWRKNVLEKGEKLDGKEAAIHLEKYSEIENKYTQLILAIIKKHELDKVD